MSRPALSLAPAPRSALAAVPDASAVHAPITVAEVEAAQHAWCEALIAISAEYDSGGHAAAKRLAGHVLDTAYGFDLGPVLFKPTLTVAPQTFRLTREGALAYFVGDAAYPEDAGFGLRQWRRYRIDNAGIVITGDSAFSMGNVTLWNAADEMTRVDKTWGYVRGGDGALRIVLHHSSLPYSPQ